MFVKSIMISKYHCHTVSIDDSLEVVLKKLDEKQIEAVPVLNGEKYAGTITRYRIYKQAFLSELPRSIFLKDLKASDIAEQNKTLTGKEIFENVLVPRALL